MAVIRLDNFGGESPRTPARNLPAGMAQLSNNLLATATEFRPLLDEVVVSTLNEGVIPGSTGAVSNPKTIRRFTKTTAGNPDISDFTASWGASTAFLSLAKGQINDDLTERTYYTNNDAGGARVFDNTGFDKALGVPPPDAPTVVATITNEYTYEEDTKARERIPLEMYQAVVNSASEVLVGDAPSPIATATTAGWIPHSAATGLGVTNVPGDWAFLTPMSGDLIVDTALSYMAGVEFGGKKVTYLGGTHWAVPVSLQGVGIEVSSPLLTAGFQAVQTPDPQTVREIGPHFLTERQQFPNSGIAEAVVLLVTEYSTANTAIQPGVAALVKAKESLQSALTNYQNQTTLAAMVTAFYSKTDVAAEITAAIGNFAKSIVTAEVGILTPPVFEGGGA